MLSVTPQSLIASQTDVVMFSPVPDAILDTHISWSTPSPDITTGSQSTISLPAISDNILPSQ